MLRFVLLLLFVIRWEACIAFTPMAILLVSRQQCYTTTRSTTTTTTTTKLQMGFFQGLFGEDLFGTKPKAAAGPESYRRRKLTKVQQEEILELKRSIVLSSDAEKPDRSIIEGFIEQIAPLSPVVQPAFSPELQKKWIVLYTTEKEINFFYDTGVATAIYQEITPDNTISNTIQFSKGGLFVDGILSEPDDANDSTQAGIRTNFVFTKATLDLGFIKVNVPPVGKGWFDTVYLDDDFRIDVNSRNDILIAYPE